MGLGGVFIFLMPLYSWGLFSLLDAITGLNEDNADPNTPDDDLSLYTLLPRSGSRSSFSCASCCGSCRRPAI